jgi:CHAD domain-containing protein
MDAVSFPTSPNAVKAAPLKLSRRMNVEQAFEAVARGCIEQIEANEAGVSRFHDAESLHQMRVGLRRLDAALTLFGDVVCVPKDIERETEWLMNQLGPTRDLDVLMESTLPRVSSAVPGQDSIGVVQKALQEKAVGLHHQAGTTVGSARFKQLIAGLESWIEQRGWRAGLSGKARMRLKMHVTEFAGALLDKESQRLLKRGNKLKGASVRDRHRVRIAAKRTRYATEFFASLYPRKRVRPYVQALSTLQDYLGWLNDAAVAERLLGELSDSDDGLREGAALVRGYLASDSEQSEPRVRKLWKKFAPMHPPH